MRRRLCVSQVPSSRPAWLISACGRLSSRMLTTSRQPGYSTQWALRMTHASQNLLMLLMKRQVQRSLPHPRSSKQSVVMLRCKSNLYIFQSCWPSIIASTSPGWQSASQIPVKLNDLTCDWLHWWGLFYSKEDYSLISSHHWNPLTYFFFSHQCLKLLKN